MPRSRRYDQCQSSSPPWREITISLSVIILALIIGAFWGPKESPPSVPPAPSFWDNVYAQRYLENAGVNIDLTDQKMRYEEKGLITAHGEKRVDTLMSVMIQLVKNQSEKVEMEKNRLFSGVIFNTRKEKVEITGIFPTPFILDPGQEKTFEVPRGTLLGYVRGMESQQIWDFKQNVPPKTGPFSWKGKILDLYLKVY